jgi:tRNA threonylcarbamoyladenosine biosynthesis protein TsaE
LIRFPPTVKTENEFETEKLASEFMTACKNGDRIVLNGNLGSGKTFFIKSSLKSIGITSVNSPSFAIVNEYYSTFKIYHFDFFRLKKASELFDIGWQDYLNDDDSIVFIEWGNMFPEVLPEERIEIQIEMLNGSKREFSFKKI